MIAALLPTTVLDIVASASVMLIGATCPEELGRGRLAPRLVELGPYEPAPGNAGSIPPYGWEPPVAMTLGRASVPGAVETSPPHAGPELSPSIPLGRSPLEPVTAAPPGENPDSTPPLGVARGVPGTTAAVETSPPLPGPLSHSSA